MTSPNITSITSSDGSKQNVFVSSSGYNIAEMLQESLESQIKIQKSSLELKSTKQDKKQEYFAELEDLSMQLSSQINSFYIKSLSPSYSVESASSDFSVEILDMNTVGFNSDMNIALKKAADSFFATQPSFKSSNDLLDFSTINSFVAPSFNFDYKDSSGAFVNYSSKAIDLKAHFNNSVVSVEKIASFLQEEYQNYVFNDILGGSGDIKDVDVGVQVEEFFNSAKNPSHGIVVRGLHNASDFAFNIVYNNNVSSNANAMSKKDMLHAFSLNSNKEVVCTINNSKSFRSNTGLFDDKSKDFSTYAPGLSISALRETEEYIGANLFIKDASQDRSFYEEDFNNISLKFNTLIDLIEEATYFDSANFDNSGPFVSESAVLNLKRNMLNLASDLSMGFFDFNIQKGHISFNYYKMQSSKFDYKHSMLGLGQEPDLGIEANYYKDSLLIDFQEYLETSYSNGHMSYLRNSLDDAGSKLSKEFDRLFDKKASIEENLVASFSMMQSVNFQVEQSLKIMESMFGVKNEK